MQPKLLTALEQGQFRRLGETTTRVTDVRLIAATSRNLASMVKEGRFREDLLFRINTVEIRLPPLRDRREDIPLLAAEFLQRHARRYGKALEGFEPEAMESLLQHPWPGNVRELEHAIERAVLLAPGQRVGSSDIGLSLREASSAQAFERLTLDEVERELIRRALKRHDGNVSEAAKSLGLSRSALYRRLERHGL